ncbi:MAG: hypothetical protein H8D82_01610, partial [Euryarchaeota archaeon]|nr:hypothetical protein [Euryarchaeota archaeon]
ALLAILPLFLFKYPNGVDWIGFSTLSHRLVTNGDLSLPAISSGYWTYPPGFPAVCALLESVIGLSPSDSVHLTGQLSLFALMWGIAGAADRWGSSGSTLLVLALAPALFVKAHDSGYPTVASQLGLVIGLLMLMKHKHERKRRQEIVFAICVITTGVIHPTAALYIGTLLLAYLVTHKFGIRRDFSISRMAITSSIVLSVAAYIVLVVFAPRLLSEPVFSEYGWQGGVTLILFNGPFIIGLAGYAIWRYSSSVEMVLVGIWICINWLMTLIHLFNGIIAFSMLTLLSYVLYSMALHGFHIPMAVAAGILLSNSPRLTPRQRPISVDEKGEQLVQEMLQASREVSADDIANSAAEAIESESNEMWIPMKIPEPTDRRWVTVTFVIVIFQLTIANAFLIELSTHEELWVQTEGDRELMRELNLPQGSVLFTEDAHWGNIYDLEEGIGVTTFPSLGLVDVQENNQGRARNAILDDDTQKIQELGITHALTSPLGKFGEIFATSPYWELVKDEDGSRLWEFSETPTVNSATTSSFVYPQQSDCLENCEWRKDAWWMVDADQLVNRPSSQPFIENGELTLELPINRESRDQTVKVNVMVDAPAGLDIEVYAIDGSEIEGRKYQTNGGWQQLTLITRTGLNNSMNIEIVVSGGGDAWVNPLYITGRGDKLLDHDGVRVHWAELRPMVA